MELGEAVTLERHQRRQVAAGRMSADEDAIWVPSISSYVLVGPPENIPAIIYWVGVLGAWGEPVASSYKDGGSGGNRWSHEP